MGDNLAKEDACCSSDSFRSGCPHSDLHYHGNGVDDNLHDTQVVQYRDGWADEYDGGHEL